MRIMLFTILIKRGKEGHTLFLEHSLVSFLLLLCTTYPPFFSLATSIDPILCRFNCFIPYQK